MQLSDPRHLQSFLKEEGLRAQKRFSQNFLVDAMVLHRIVDETMREGIQRVLEIGPGPGVLTEELLKRGAQVWAIELDRGMAQALERRSHPNLTVIQADALQCSLEPIEQGGVEVMVGNLPYAITAPLLGRFLPMHTRFKRLVVMVQWEVAQRLLAVPGTKQWGLLSLFVQACSTPKLVCRVPSSSFRPQPKVDSAVVSLELRAPPERMEEAMVWAKRAFQQRRKMLRSSLSGYVEREALDWALRQASLRPEQRPEELNLDQWLSLLQSLALSNREEPIATQQC
ncbi:MAG: 16S rRNA (adenine(1518)-N(6)/adenine(1519)-N(6))-dimethyltransferase RsmA [Chlamydiia bacterium]